ncbi:hypothetical protein [Pseudoclavibacter sp. AY1H1]|uniref:hypothetical protein n=1 Tax=Pseudoclavibacter sp. AY1H1 TaxID=2080584 RepID=UPI000CE8A15C|nr:hypothetical protein [Pseudoclavibacter sp. AY1H1]PPF34011.1 hypothetical protein C5E05_16030 [Pseudoclavibacter sp. AY1H1]
MIELIPAALADAVLAQSVLAEEGHHIVNELVMPPIMFGVVTLVAFVALIVVTYAFRNTWHSNPVDSKVVPYEPFNHAGVIESGSEHSKH